MSDIQNTYWSVFNLLGKVVGLCFALVGIISIIYGIASGGALYVVPGLVVGALGVLLFLAKPYRPSSDDSKPSDKI